MSDNIPTTEETEEYAIDICIKEQCERSRHAKVGEPYNLAEWVVGELHVLDRAEDDIKDRAKRHLAFLLSECKGRRAGLLWKYANAIQSQVDAELAGKKRRSITYATGRAGYRTVGGRESLVIDEPAVVIAWAEKNCPQAVVKSISPSAVKEHYKTTGEVPPGCSTETTPKGDAFYIGPVTVTRPQLPSTAPNADRLSAREFLGGSTAETPFE